ncbi:alpha/beta fold hydrolase [Rhodococcus xishaensis]|uniref:Alpha/beta hydrolase n=1 Tax=Rhodococcus xishaensis TaxID=2487364 RepID=A0A3S3BFZ2_9NOCA|nr:alpha/beta hydrolase [Rhodococcus xishaensis]RVW00288.1 alpha/beta hydrolase [Rhodococcus xishaensis]
MTAVLHAHRYGPAGPIRVLAIHGLAGHGYRWRQLARQYLDDLPLVAPDLLGHGRSSWAAPWTLEANVAALATLIEQDADQPVMVVGHSFGGGLALHLAAARPDLVDSLVLLDPAIGLDGHWMRRSAEELLEAPDYADRDEARQHKALDLWSDVPASELEAELDEHLIPWPAGRVGWRVCLPAMVSYWSELARPIVVPRERIRTTLLRSTRTDPSCVTPALIEALKSGLGSNFELVNVACKHMVPLARPTETAAAIRRRLV